MIRIVALVGILVLALTSPARAADVPPGYGMTGVKIAVKDFQKAIDFYTTLGMKVGPKHNETEWELNWENPAQGVRIILVHDETGRMKLVPGGAFLMMRVPNVKAMADKLRMSGHPDVGEPRVTERYAMLMLKDPDSNQIEMLGPPK